VNIKQSILRPLAHAVYNRGPFSGVVSYGRVLKEFFAYRHAVQSAGLSEQVRLQDLSPWPIDRYDSAGDAGMYFYQDTWCASKIREKKLVRHVDVGSSMMFVAMTLQLCELLYVDLRPIGINIPGFTFQCGDLTDLPFANDSQESISSLSVLEHVGLGRYGDRLDPMGTDKACADLTRVLKPGGALYVAVPTQARSSTHFNAHRIFAPGQFIAKFPGLVLIDEKYGLSDKLVSSCEYDELGMPYAFGCFLFTKPTDRSSRHSSEMGQ
jgi:SAM-dependent methyltransferase